MAARALSDRSRILIAANRLPVREATIAGERTWLRSPGGLVTTLEPVVRAHDAHWVGWSGQELSDIEAVPFEHDGMFLHPLPLPETEFTDYYEGFANSTIWPLYHDAVIPPVFEERWWDAYVRVNERFAHAAAAVAAPDSVVWVQDYHLQLMPSMIRQLRPDIGIGFFMHIPVPPFEVFRRLPQREEIMRGLLGADLIGFQLPRCAENFRQIARDLLDLPVRGDAIAFDGRLVRTGGFAASVDVAGIDEQARDPAVVARAERLRAALPEARTMIFAVDRLDYTKGIEQRLVAIRELFDESRLRAPDVCVVQIVARSREGISTYQGLRRRIEAEVQRINDAHGQVVHYRDRTADPHELIAHYVAADVMAVTPLHDGMNLVAKEFVAARVDESGALVLSEFAGAAAELRQAYLVNPYDRRALKDVLCRAVEAPSSELADRMRQMRAYLRDHDVWDWARAFLAALDEARAGDG